jgi:hypothetical protein
LELRAALAAVSPHKSLASILDLDSLRSIFA